MAIEIGKKAPSFTLEGSDGNTHKPADYIGKTLVIYFYPKDDTPGCTKESCQFASLSKQIESLGAVILGVSKDSIDSHNAFIEKYNLPFVLLSDPSGKMMERYEAWGEKNMYGKLTIGTIRSTVIIDPDGKVVKRWKKVPKAEAHPAKVLEWLEEN